MPLEGKSIRPAASDVCHFRSIRVSDLHEHPKLPKRRSRRYHADKGELMNCGIGRQFVLCFRLMEVPAEHTRSPGL